MNENDVFVQRGIRGVKLLQLSLGAFLHINTDVILPGDAIQANQCLVLGEIKECDARMSG